MTETENNTGTPCSRNDFGAIRSYPDWVTELLQSLDGTAWTSGIESDKKHRGTSINLDVYSYDEQRQLAVAQVRECTFHPKRFNRVRKDYYLIGRNENGNAFAHPIETVARSRRAMASAEAGVLLALSRIWECEIDELDHIVRNGDVAFVPAVLPTGATLVGNHVGLRVATSHAVEAEELYEFGGRLYVKGHAKIDHLKGQHPTARVKSRVWRIQAGLRASNWGFTTPTTD